MTTNVTRRRLLGACVVGLSVLSGCTGATPFVGKWKEFNHELDSTANRLTVATNSGNATVSRTDAEKIQLHGIKKAASVFANIEDMTVEMTQNGDHLRISADAETGSFLGLGANRSPSMSEFKKVSPSSVSRRRMATSPQPASSVMLRSKQRTAR